MRGGKIHLRAPFLSCWVLAPSHHQPCGWSLRHGHHVHILVPENPRDRSQEHEARGSGKVLSTAPERSPSRLWGSGGHRCGSDERQVQRAVEMGQKRVKLSLFVGPQYHSPLLFSAIHQSPLQEDRQSVSTRTSYDRGRAASHFSSYLSQGPDAGDTRLWCHCWGHCPTWHRTCKLLAWPRALQHPPPLPPHVFPLVPLLCVTSPRSQSPQHE